MEKHPSELVRLSLRATNLGKSRDRTLAVGKGAARVDFQQQMFPDAALWRKIPFRASGGRIQQGPSEPRRSHHKRAVIHNPHNIQIIWKLGLPIEPRFDLRRRLSPTPRQTFGQNRPWRRDLEHPKPTNPSRLHQHGPRQAEDHHFVIRHFGPSDSVPQPMRIPMQEKGTSGEEGGESRRMQRLMRLTARCGRACYAASCKMKALVGCQIQPDGVEQAILTGT